MTALFEYGDALGVAFQIVDDLLDFQGDAGAIGKNIGDDFRERKLTMPLIKAVAKADAEERAFWLRTIEKGKQEENDLQRAIDLLHKHGALADTRRRGPRRGPPAPKPRWRPCPRIRSRTCW